MENELISLSELAKELGINKSKLLYYASWGLIAPIQKLDKTTIYDRKEVLSKLKKIEAKRQQGKSLEEIKEELN